MPGKEKKVYQMDLYENKLVAAYVRGALQNQIPAELMEKPLDTMTEEEIFRLLELGKLTI